jgi:hypothetical protein
VPALPPVPAVLRVVYRWDVGSDTDAIIRRYFRYSGSAPDNASCVTIATDISNSWNIEFAGYTHPDVSMEEISIEDLTSPTSGVGTFAFAAAGSESGTPLPAEACALENQGIARRYRGGKPRHYWPIGSSADVLNPQFWEPSSISNWNAALAAHLAAVAAISVAGTTTLVPVSVSYYQGFTPVTNPITGRTKDVAKLRVGSPVIDPVTSETFNQRIASQRRRSLFGS